MVKLNFEIKEELESEIKKIRKRIDELIPEAKKELEETGKKGKNHLAINRLAKAQREKEKELKKVNQRIAKNNELAEDPVKRVKSMYSHRKNNEKSIEAANRVISNIDRLLLSIDEFNHSLTDRALGLNNDTTRLSVMKNNLHHKIQYQLKPIIEERYKAEIKKAQDRVDELRRKKEEEIKLDNEIEDLVKN